MKVKDLVLIGMMSAILVAAQVGIAIIPNVELVSLLIILFTLIFGWKTLFIIYTFVFIEGIIFGFGYWWMNYLYVWTILFGITMVFRRQTSGYFWAMISGFFGLSFGALCSLIYFFMGGVPAMMGYWVNGILFDLVHGIANFIVALVLFTPLHRLLSRLYYKWSSN